MLNVSTKYLHIMQWFSSRGDLPQSARGTFGIVRGQSWLSQLVRVLL